MFEIQLTHNKPFKPCL